MYTITMKFLKKILGYTLGAIIILLFAFVIYFNRMPERLTPIGDHIVSPANGKIIEIKDVTSPDIVFQKKGVENHVSIPEINEPMHVVLIEMNLSDVHVQRAPISGIVLRTEHFDGKHKNALGKDADILMDENEKVVTVFGNEKEKIGVVQVAGLAARRIRNMIETNDSVVQGEIYGKILLGSQVVVMIPETRNLNVAVGDTVIDGETILAK